MIQNHLAERPHQLTQLNHQPVVYFFQNNNKEPLGKQVTSFLTWNTSPLFSCCMPAHPCPSAQGSSPNANQNITHLLRTLPWLPMPFKIPLPFFLTLSSSYFKYSGQPHFLFCLYHFCPRSSNGLCLASSL